MSDSANTHIQLQFKFKPGFMLAAIFLLTGCSSSPGKLQSPDLLPECGWLPNCINTQSGQGIQASEPISANAEQWQQLKAWIARQEDWEITIDDSNFVHAVVKTPAIGFRDDVQLLFLPGKQLIQVRSASRVGLSDLGTNARRIETLRDQLKP
jgi:uncharacterized protein (DUF1499 family)